MLDNIMVVMIGEKLSNKLHGIAKKKKKKKKQNYSLHYI